ncbi:hypothetical protein D3C86_1592430 [compost metagenome]
MTGVSYEFTIDVRKVNSSAFNEARLVLSIENKNSSELKINHSEWKSYSFAATATSTSMTVRLENRQPMWDGNDFCIDNLRVKSLSTT